MKRVIEVEHLRKAYGSTVAVDDVSFGVDHGEIFGIVGPNGAGKTTLVESIAGLRRPDRGVVRVLGLDPQDRGGGLSQRIGVQLQHAALPERVKVWEALDLYASYYDQSVDWRPLMHQWGLDDKRDTYFMDLSGGQKQRLFIALALVNDPQVVFLDELTAGLDPQARRNAWDLVRAIRDQGTTVMLVTHLMDEAERLCDRVAIIDHGSFVALDTPAELIRGIQVESRIFFSVSSSFEPEWLRSIPDVDRVELRGGDVIVTGSGAMLAPVVAALAEHGLVPPDLRTEQPTLEDVFLALTGRQDRE